MLQSSSVSSTRAVGTHSISFSLGHHRRLDGSVRAQSGGRHLVCLRGLHYFIPTKWLPSKVVALITAMRLAETMGRLKAYSPHRATSSAPAAATIKYEFSSIKTTRYYYGLRLVVKALLIQLLAGSSNSRPKFSNQSSKEGRIF